MKAFDAARVRQWIDGQRAAAQVAPPRTSAEQALLRGFELAELTWPVANDALNRRLHEEDAARARAVWVELARRAGLLPVASAPRRSRSRASSRRRASRR